MPALQKSCVTCSGLFYGRADATYCSSSCRQKAYRRRRADVVPPLPSGPVPDGHEWMHDRFSVHASEVAAAGRHRARVVDGDAATSEAGHQRLVDESDELAVRTIQAYVANVAELARYDCNTGVVDFDTPLGEALPGALNAATAVKLAAELTATLPRLQELASLLQRRARTASRDSTSPSEITVNQVTAASAVPLFFKRPLDSVSTYDGHN